VCLVNPHRKLVHNNVQSSISECSNKKQKKIAKIGPVMIELHSTSHSSAAAEVVQFADQLRSSLPPSALLCNACRWTDSGQR